MTDMARDLPANYVKVLRIRDSNGEEKALQFPVSLDLERPKRARTTFTEEQVRELEAAFARDGYLVGEARRSLALRLQLSDTQVKVWFQNRRTKNRKKGTESSREEKTSPREQPLPVFLGAMSWLPPLSFLADNSSPMRS